MLWPTVTWAQSSMSGTGTSGGSAFGAPPTTPNGVTFTACETPSGGVAGALGYCWPGVSVNAQTGTGYTVLATDRGSLITVSNAGAQTLTVPDGGTTNFANNFNFAVKNIGAGTWTLTRTAASTLNCGSTLAVTTCAIAANQAAYVYLNPSNNWDVVVVPTNGGGAPAFNAVTSGTNTTAAMVVGSGASLAATGTGTIVPTSLPVNDCKLASSLGFLLNDTDETTLFQTTMNNFQSNGGGCLLIDSNKTLGVFGQIVLTNSGATPWSQNPIRIAGVSAPSFTLSNTQPARGTGGSILDLRYASASLIDGRIISLGQGDLEIDHLQVVNNGTSCGTVIYSTLTNVRLHDNAFYGSTSNTGTSSCDDVWVAGGLGNGTLTGTNTDLFQGFGSYVDHNQADYIRRLVYGRGSFNSISITNNVIGLRSGSNITVSGVAVGPFELDGNSNNSPTGDVFSNNLIEDVGYSCSFTFIGNDGTHGAGTVQGNVLYANSLWDNSSGAGYCADTSAVTRNLVIAAKSSVTNTFNAGWSLGTNTYIDGTGSTNTTFGWPVNFRNTLGFGSNQATNYVTSVFGLDHSMMTNGTLRNGGQALCTDSNYGATTVGCSTTLRITNFNQAAQSQVVVSGTEYYITNSDLDMPAVYSTAIAAGTTMKWRIALTKTAAGTGTFQILLKKGTNGSIADTSIVTQTIGTQTAAADNMEADIQLTWTSATAAYWTIVPHQSAASGTGFGLVYPATAAQFSGTISGQTTTTASDKYGLSVIFTTGTPTFVVNEVQAQAFGVN